MGGGELAQKNLLLFFLNVHTYACAHWDITSHLVSLLVVMKDMREFCEILLSVRFKVCSSSQNRGNCGVMGVSRGAICIFCAKSVQYRHHH